MTASTLDIILPCYNPQAGWSEGIIHYYKEICKALPHIKIQVLLVNDGSVKTVNQAEIGQLKSAIPIFQYLHYEQNKGKGYALRQGVQLSTAEIIIYTDVDFPYTTESFLKIFQALAQNRCDIAAGIKSRSYYNHVPGTRKAISKMLHFFIRTFLRIKISDTQCGLKGFTEHAKATFLKTSINRYLFDLEFIFLASRQKELVLIPVEIELRPGVEFTVLPYKILFGEAYNFMKIFIRSIFTR